MDTGNELHMFLWLTSYDVKRINANMHKLKPKI